jgi:glycosyltransferase involved in cell wall biosynthesis
VRPFDVAFFVAPGCVAIYVRTVKIVMVHPHDVFSSFEPWTVRIRALSRELARIGHEVELVTFTLDGFEYPAFEQDGVRVHCFSRRVSLRGHFEKTKRFGSLFRGADVVFFQKCFHYASVPAVRAARQNGAWIHYDWDDDETAIFFSGARGSALPVGAGMWFLERLLPSLADSVSVASRALYDRALCFGARPETLFRLPVGADPAPVRLEEVESIRRRYALSGISQIYVGQLHGGQYAELLLRALRELGNAGISSRTLFVGDGYDRPRLESLRDELGMRREAIFTGAVPHEDIPAYLAACRIAVACFESNRVTRSKSPLKIAEYLASGKCIVAHAVGEVPGMLGDAGLLVEAGGPGALARALLSLHREPGRIVDLEQRALRRAPGFAWARRAEKLDRFFRRIDTAGPRRVASRASVAGGRARRGTP